MWSQNRQFSSNNLAPRWGAGQGGGLYGSHSQRGSGLYGTNNQGYGSNNQGYGSSYQGYGSNNQQGSYGAGYGSSGSGFATSGAPNYGTSGGGYPSTGDGYASPLTSYGRSNRGGGGYHASYSGGYGKDCPGVPFALLLTTLLGVAVMGVIFYLKVQAAGRRRRRSLDGEEFDWGEVLVEELPSLVAIGRRQHISCTKHITCTYCSQTVMIGKQNSNVTHDVEVLA